MFYRVARVSRVVVGHVLPLVPPHLDFTRKTALCSRVQTDIIGNGSHNALLFREIGGWSQI